MEHRGEQPTDVVIILFACSGEALRISALAHGVLSVVPDLM
jgi:hypothetical protein